jgi:MYXO-CTERM domain-containing protein
MKSFLLFTACLALFAGSSPTALAGHKSALRGTASGPIHDAGGAFSALSTTGLSVVPEPAVAMLGSLGMLGLLRRRRMH